MQSAALGPGRFYPNPFAPMTGHAIRAPRFAWLLLFWGIALTCHAARIGIATDSDSSRRRIEELRTEIARHDELYFKQAKAEISDTEYDRLKQELQFLEAAHPELSTPLPDMGDDRSGRFPAATHRQRMGSLDKAYSEADWRTFHAKLSKDLGRTDLVFVVEPKYDGLAISLTYERGVLVRAVTRGNGTEGDDVTANVRMIEALPPTLQPGPLPPPALVELRGEIYLDDAEFARINAEREAAGEELFAHPRNLAVGTLKSADPAEVVERRLSIVLYGWGAWEGGKPPQSQLEFHGQLRAWGLPVVKGIRIARTADEAWVAVRTLARERTALGFPTDGAVVKLDDTALRARIGEGPAAPRWAVACKFEPEKAVTRLRAITIQVGRTGVLTPVAEFEPVELGGATVARATLHNRDEIRRRDLRIGDFIEVEKAGDIIPAVTGVQVQRRPAEAVPYVFPERCPSCQTPVVAKAGEAAVRCPNTHCAAQRQRRLEHFASVQAVGLKGFGPATISALVRAGRLQGPADYYRLRREDLLAAEGVGEKSADRLLAEIESSKQAELARFIHGLSIPQVGATTAFELASLSGDLAGFARLGGSRLVDAVGPAAAESVTEFLARPENQADLRALIVAGVNARADQPIRANLQGKVFVFTGTLPGLTRAHAAKQVQAAGGVVRDSVSGKTDYVVAGEGAGAKLADARRLGVTVLSPAEFARLLGMP